MDTQIRRANPTPAPGTEGKLEPVDADRLRELEDVIEGGLHPFAQVGAALLEIRDQRLYRASHKTFETYLRDRWHISHSYAARTIAAAQIVAMLPFGNTPRTEAVARELVPLKSDPVKVAQAWGQAIEARLKEAGLTKIVPDAARLEEAYRRAYPLELLNRAIDAATEKADKRAAAVKLPKNMVAQIEKHLEEHPEEPWDDAITDLVAKALENSK
jgi:hypothetical protein